MQLNDTHEVEMRTLGPLTFVYYQEEGYDELVGAHCLELDIGGQGVDRNEATQNLQAAIETYVQHHLDTGEKMELRRAPPDLANLPDRVTLHLILVTCHAHPPEPEPRRQVKFVDPPPRDFSLDPAFA